MPTSKPSLEICIVRCQSIGPCNARQFLTPGITTAHRSITLQGDAPAWHCSVTRRNLKVMSGKASQQPPASGMSALAYLCCLFGMPGGEEIAEANSQQLQSSLTSSKDVYTRRQNILEASDMRNVTGQLCLLICPGCDVPERARSLPAQQLKP